MRIKIPIALIIISVIAIFIDCYAGYGLFLMTAMPIGHYLSPILLLFLVVSVPITFIASIIGLFRFKKWAYRTFFTLTLLLHSFLIYIDIYDLTIKAIKRLEIQQIFPMVSLFVFVVYFLLPSVRKLFK
jgi:hypothetical protein